MPASYEISAEDQLKYVNIAGSIELDELVALANKYFNDPNYDPDHRFLVDLRYLEDSSARFIDVFTLYSLYKQKVSATGKTITVAIAAPSDFAFGLSKMLFALANMGSVMRIHIFDGMPEAASWLDVPEDRVAALSNSVFAELKN